MLSKGMTFWDILNKTCKLSFTFLLSQGSFHSQKYRFFVTSFTVLPYTHSSYFLFSFLPHLSYVICLSSVTLILYFLHYLKSNIRSLPYTSWLHPCLFIYFMYNIHCIEHNQRTRWSAYRVCLANAGCVLPLLLLFSITRVRRKTLQTLNL